MTAAMLALVSVELPIRLESVSNMREHWSRTAKRAKAHRTATFFALSMPLTIQRRMLADSPIGGRARVKVTITRISPCKLDSHDNLRVSAKAVVDGVADALAINDRDARVEWAYGQEKRPKTFAARIEVQILEVA